MLNILLTFFTAIALSAIAGYYSIVGLASIFPGAFWPVVVMGSVMELGKLVTVSWLYRNWKTAPKILKAYLTVAVTILMLITSMGIFGFLSKAHLEHSADMNPVAERVSILDEKIRFEKENIDAGRKALKQMDEAVDQVMGRSNDEKGADKAVQIRRTQQKDRNRILQEIQQSQATIAKYSEERAPISNELKKVENEIGPIKYIAALAYGAETPDVIDKAVRLVIMLIMVVFDPLAVLLLISANISLKAKDEKKTYTYTSYEEPKVQSTESVQAYTEEEIGMVQDNLVQRKQTIEISVPIENTERVSVAKVPESMEVKLDSEGKAREDEKSEKLLHIPKENLTVIDFTEAEDTHHVDSKRH